MPNITQCVIHHLYPSNCRTQRFELVYIVLNAACNSEEKMRHNTQHTFLASSAETFFLKLTSPVHLMNLYDNWIVIIFKMLLFCVVTRLSFCVGKLNDISNRIK